MERFAPRFDVLAFTLVEMATAFAGLLAIALALGQLSVPHGWTVWGALARDRGLRERARVPGPDLGAAADDRHADGARVLARAGVGGGLRLRAGGRPPRRGGLAGLRRDHGRDRRSPSPPRPTCSHASYGSRGLPYDCCRSGARLGDVLRRDDRRGPARDAQRHGRHGRRRERDAGDPAAGAPRRARRRCLPTRPARCLAVPARRAAGAGWLADPLHPRDPRGRRLAHLGDRGRCAARRGRDRVGRSSASRSARRSCSGRARSSPAASCWRPSGGGPSTSGAIGLALRGARGGAVRDA